MDNKHLVDTMGQRRTKPRTKEKNDDNCNQMPEKQQTPKSMQLCKL
jgi:hypothetical protein